MEMSLEESNLEFIESKGFIMMGELRRPMLIDSVEKAIRRMSMN